MRVLEAIQFEGPDSLSGPLGQISSYLINSGLSLPYKKVLILIGDNGETLHIFDAPATKVAFDPSAVMDAIPHVINTVNSGPFQGTEIAGLHEAYSATHKVGAAIAAGLAVAYSMGIGLSRALNEYLSERPHLADSGLESVALPFTDQDIVTRPGKTHTRKSILALYDKGKLSKDLLLGAVPEKKRSLVDENDVKSIVKYVDLSKFQTLEESLPLVDIYRTSVLPESSYELVDADEAVFNFVADQVSSIKKFVNTMAAPQKVKEALKNMNTEDESAAESYLTTKIPSEIRSALSSSPTLAKQISEYLDKKKAALETGDNGPMLEAGQLFESLHKRMSQEASKLDYRVVDDSDNVETVHLPDGFLETYRRIKDQTSTLKSVVRKLESVSIPVLSVDGDMDIDQKDLSIIARMMESGEHTGGNTIYLPYVHMYGGKIRAHLYKTNVDYVHKEGADHISLLCHASFAGRGEVLSFGKLTPEKHAGGIVFKFEADPSYQQALLAAPFFKVLNKQFKSGELMPEVIEEVLEETSVGIEKLLSVAKATFKGAYNITNKLKALAKKGLKLDV